ncbi:proteasome activator [Nonomuraea zeae]|uniref:Bacterial proteasome activator n=1 Tax=Nonomuraea zeae TaxID=1642303 RepID=A0A5S4FCX4_9ACTN|nr:proteasome activator [Nonomuraea zeae]TMR16174.1 DUF2587 domain-containing protein [Nonomuraea zeae]
MTATPGPNRPDRFDDDDDVQPESPNPTMETEVERIREPARLLRVTAMARSLLDEARGLPLDEHARVQLGRIHARAVEEIAEAVAPELRDELARLLPPPSSPLSQTEIRIVHAQLVGWLDGIFQGIRTGLSLQAVRPDLQGPPPPSAGPDAGPYL